MIKTIKLKNCATYSGDGASIENCQKINFFYGHNGSGKSTVGKFLQEPSAEQYKYCELEWDNSPKADVIVYNRDFREKNFKENIAGVFTLGQASIDDRTNLDEMKKQRTQKNDDYTKRQETLNQKEQEEIDCKAKFRETVWDKIFKPNDAEFKEAFTSLRSSKDRFRDEVLKRFQKSHSSNENRENLLIRAKTLFAQKPEIHERITWNLDDTISQIIDIETTAIWNKVIVGNKDLPIGRIIQALNNSDWVNEGRKHVKDDGICPFCQQPTITPDLRNQLDAFFSGEYERDVNFITNSINRYKVLSDEFLRYVNSVLTNIDAYPSAWVDKEKFGAVVELLAGYFSKNHTQMLIKEKEPGRIVVLSYTSETINSVFKLIAEVNNAVDKHNKMVNNFALEKDALISDIWAYLMKENEILVDGYLKDIENLGKAKKGIENGIGICKQQLDELDKKIIEAGKKLTSIQPTIDEINRLLKSYGFTNFKIVSSPLLSNAYQIQRIDGTLASNTLSEGEETFISFLYFLQFAKGSIDIKKVSNRKILVLDDPICSLDSTVLYIVSSLVKGLIKDVRKGVSDVEQIFILTHNVFFHKETAFIDSRADECNDINYWIINKNNNISSIQSYGRTNPIKTSYELLWQELKNPLNTSLVTVQNIMRRILENYFRVLGKTSDDTIINSFSTLEEKMICRSLLSWVNDGSHSIPDDVFIDSYTDSVERYKQIFKAIFYNMNHAAHFDMMMR